MAEKFGAFYQLAFFSVFVLLGLLELTVSMRRQSVQREARWNSNITLFLINGVVVHAILPVSIVAFAMGQPPGLMTRLGFGLTTQFLLTFLLLDLWRYWEHRLFHIVPLFWRAHLVHHSDTQIDVTTTERHHPFEALLGAVLLLALVAVLGLPAEAIAFYLIVAGVAALFSHANLRLPATLDRWLRLITVTPAVHVIHHSASRAQTDSNYSTVLTVWDRLFGTYTDPDKSKIPHIGLEYFHQPPDTGLLRVLLQPFLFRQRTAYPSRDVVEHSPTPTPAVAEMQVPRLSANWKAALLGAAVASALALLVLWPTVLDLAALWMSNEAYRYGWLVMPMVVYLLGWHFRDEILALSPKSDFTGVIVATAAAVCWGAAELLNINVGRQFGLVLALQGIAMSALGWRLYWRLFPVLALMFMMVPGGDVLQPALRHVTVKSIDLFATVAGLPHSSDGFFISIGKLRYVVVDACSGLAHVNLTLFLGYCFGLLLFRSVVKIAALTLFAGFLGLLSNVLRVNAIVLIDWNQGTQMDLAAHGNIQWVALSVVLALLLCVLTQLKPDPTPVALPASTSLPSAHKVRYAPVIAGLMVLLIAGVAAWMPTNARRPSHGIQTEWLPRNIQDWALAKPLAPWVVDKQNDTESIAMTYERKDQEMRVVIVETLSANAKLVESRLSQVGPGVWSDTQARKATSCIEQKCLAFVHTTWQRGKKYLPRHAYHAYSIGGFNTDSKLALRAAQGWNRLRAGNSNPRLIGLTFDGPEPSVDEVASVYLKLQMALNEVEK